MEYPEVLGGKQQDLHSPRQILHLLEPI